MAEQDKTGASTSRWLAWRMWIQAAFLLVWLDPLALRLHNLCGPVFHCYACPLATFACPIGVLANFSALHLFPFMAVGLLVAVGAVFGSMVCGWACPFGLLQDLAAKVPTPKLDLPRWTGHLRYVVLVGTVLAVPFLFGESHPLFVCNFCPAGAIEGAVPSMVQQAAAGQPVVLPNALKLGVLFAFLGAVFFVRRPWCRILCPLGAIFSIFNRTSVFFLRLDPGKCTQCKRCHKLCELGLQPDRSPNDSRCIRCLDCTRCSPGALRLDSILNSDKTSGKSV